VKAIAIRTIWPGTLLLDNLITKAYTGQKTYIGTGSHVKAVRVGQLGCPGVTGRAI